jgi:hypothetical protein
LKRTIFIVCLFFTVIGGLVYLNVRQNIRNSVKQNELLQEIARLKSSGGAELVIDDNKYKLDRTKIEFAISRNLNETDWNVLNILLEDPSVSNRGIAEKAFLRVDGIGSSLRRMYEYFGVKETKYKKISLILSAIQISKN